eukprot:XP_011680542.1 PREDICTED: neurobeachin-like protein 1 isoform X2 [Strongylocentrotus purpuratus]
MYDPLHLWRRHLSNHVGKTTQSSRPALLSVEVVPFFYDCLSNPTWSIAIKSGLHCHVLHMFGAIVTGSKPNAQMATTPPTVDMLFRLLTSESDHGVTRGPDSEKHSVTELVLRCLVQMIKVIHSCCPEERQVELSELLEQLLQALRSSHRNSDVQYAIFRSIPQTLLDSCSNKSSLQRAFVKADVFTTLLTILETATVSDGNKQLAVFFTVHLLGAILNGSLYAKEIFKETIGYDKLGELIDRLGTPSQELIETLMDMVFDTPYKPDNKLLIQNTGVVSLLLFLLPLIHHNPTLQEFVVDGLAHSCVSCDYNRMQCCYDGIVSGVIRALQCREQLHRKTEERLIGLLESLGAYSITSSQLKTLIGLMRGEDDQSLSGNCTRLMRALSRMARKEGKLSAHHYFDFQADETGISIPVIKKWPGSSFSFHTWVCLNTTPVTLEKGLYRRQLYSFYTASGCGFEAFFTLDGVLVVAICTKKEFFSVSLTDYPITDNNWHQVNIVHYGSKRPFVQSQLSTFIDGYLRQTSQLKFPAMGEPFVSSFISSPPTFNSLEQEDEIDSTAVAMRPRSTSTTTISSKRPFTLRVLKGQSQSMSEETPISMVPADMKYLEWGSSRSLQGQMGSACVFYDTLTPLQVKKLYAAGPNVLTLFQVDDPDLADLNSKVLIYYHGKACKDSTCMDLSRNQPYDGSLTGHSCSTGRLKDVLNCIGGVQGLFPLLELSLQGQAGSEVTTPEEVESPTASVNVENVDTDWEILPMNMQCEARLERNRISGFLSLLKNVCIGHSINQELLHKTQGLATIGALLQKAESSLIDVNVLMAVQLLVESVCAGSPHLLKSAHRHLLFDFRIWSRSDFPVRIGHIQYLATIIKDNRKTFRKAYGVQFMLDVIRAYYSGDTDITVDDSKAIRHSLRGLIRYYVYRSINHQELQCILGFIAAVKEQALIEEALDLLLSLMETPGKDQLLLLLYEHGSADLLYVLLTRPEYSDGVQVRVLKLFAGMLHSTKVQEKNKTRIRLQDIGFSGLTLLMEHAAVSMSVARTLVELVTEGQLNHRGLLAVLKTLHSANALVKLEACTQLLHILYTQPDARTQIAKIPGWQDTLARLIIKTQDNDNNLLGVEMNGFFSTKQLQASESSLDSLTTEDMDAIPLTSNHPPFTSVSNTAEGFSNSITTTSNGTAAYHESASLNSESLDQDKLERSRAATMPICASTTQIIIDRTHCNSDNSPSMPSTFPTQSDSSWSLPISVDTDSIATESTLSIDTPDDSSILCAVDSGVSLTRPSDLNISLLSERDEPTAIYDLSPGGIIQKERNEQTLVDTLIEICVQIMWLGVDGSSEDTWIARGQIFKCIADLSSSHQILRPANQIKRQMLEKLLEGAAGAIRAAGTSTAANAENALYLVKLVYDFLFGVAGSDPTSWSVKLEEGVVDLLDILQVWTATSHIEEWKEMSRLGLRLLLRFSSHNNLEICAMASARLHHLIQSRPITSPSEACFFLGSLDEALIQSLDETDGKEDTFAYMIPLARAMVDKYRDELGMSSFLVNLPSTETSPTFVEDFKEYCKSEEWRMYIEKQVQPFMHEYITNNYSDITAKMSKYWRKCFDVLNTNIHKRERERGESKLKFTTQVIEPFNAMCKTENARHASTCIKLTNQHQSTMRQWRAAKRFLIGERGAWAERNPQDIFWKLSSQENFSRMRLKLMQNYNYDQHIDASQQRDNTGVATESSSALPLGVAKEARVSDMELQDDRLGDEEWNLVNVESGGEEQGETVKEKVVISEECQLITLVDVIPGKLDITTTHVYFYDTSPEKEEVFGQDFKWSLSHLREVHLRRYNLRRSAIEVFFINQTNYFINFKDRKTRNKAYSRILSLRPPNLYYTGAKSPADLLKASGLTQKWINREISNFDYLMQLNTIAGRTYNDLSQYPVFPWILSDYSSEELDLENPEVFRDLSKPVGVVNPKHIPEVQGKYENFEDPSGTIDKFHYGTHYSNAAGVMHYLVRMEPFTMLHIQLQSGRFDCADRQFHSIESLWDTLMENPNDVKELIPEFFYLPEFLVNANKFDLGCLQTGEPVEDVILPKWAKTPEDFIHKHRQALESDYVSSHLHNWIDLIFGYKQKGPAAVEALNVFYYCTYEGAVDLDAIKDDIQRQAVEGMINNFGQTPCQLLKEPHPQRRLASSPEESTRSKGLMRTQPNFSNIFEHLDELKAFFVEASTADNDPLVYVRVPKSQTKSFIYQGMPDTMVTVTQKGVVGTHSWLPYDKSISNYFTFDRDSTLLSSKTRKLVSGPFAPGMHVTAKLFVATHDARLLFVVGHWDNSLRVFNLKSSGRLVAHVTRHMDVVTCIALDGCGMQLITGSRDTTCMVWEITYQNGVASGINNKPIQTLYGHDDEVTCVALSSQLDMAVSASKDGTIIVNTILKGHYIRTLRPPNDPNAPLSIPCLAISEEGHIIIHLRQPAASKHMQDHCSLHLYSVNGKHLCTEMNAGCLTDMEVVEDFLLTSDSRGIICFRKIFELKAVTTMRLQLPVHCLSVVPSKSQVLAGLRDGKLIIVSIDRLPEARKIF